MKEKLENLDKENFWNAIYAAHPKSVKIFCDWIDIYKKENDWNALFNEHRTDLRGQPFCVGLAPKFHDLPIAIQFGIFCQFASEIGTQYSHTGIIADFRDWRDFLNIQSIVTDYFEYLDECLENA